MYEVIKGFAGVEVGDKIPLNEKDSKYMISQGYVKAIKTKKKTKVDMTELKDK